MKAMTTTLILAAALFCAAGAGAQDQTMPNTNPGQTPAAPEQAAPEQTPPATKNSKKEAWEGKVRNDCAAEIAPGGVCENKDFDSGLEKCLHKNRSKLSDSCKAAVHPHMHKKVMKKEEKGKSAMPANSQEAPANAEPAQAPTNP